MEQEKRKIGVFLDDVFLPDQMPPYIDLWVTVENLEKFAEYITKYYEENSDLPEIISFDGCLDHTQEIYMATKIIGSNIIYSGFKKETGLQCAKWLTEFCKTKQIKLDCRLVVHEPFAQMAGDIVYWLTEFQKSENITPTVFTMNWQKKKK